MDCRGDAMREFVVFFLLVYAMGTASGAEPELRLSFFGYHNPQRRALVSIGLDGKNVAEIKQGWATTPCW